MDFPTIIRFVTQLSAVIAGASALWLVVFCFKQKKNSQWYDLVLRVTPLFFITSFSFIAGWWLSDLFIFSANSLAHEGVVQTIESFIQNGFEVNLIWVSIFSIVGILGLFAYFYKKVLFKKYSLIFFSIQFILLSIILSLTTYSGKFNFEQLAFSLHNWHSIATVGTVIVVDFLYLLTLKKDKLKRLLYPFYPIMSAVIWIGLGLDFASSLIVFEGIFVITSQFLFNQTVIAIIILNGAILSARLSKVVISTIRSDKIVALKKSTAKVIRIAGSVSIVSWLGVTFLDFFTFSYSLFQFFFMYMIFIAIAYMAKPIAEKIFS